MSARFQVAGGSVRGTRHRAQEKNNQDALHWEERGEVLVAVVADGCSSGSHSEVGAKLGVRFCTEAVFRELAERPHLMGEDPQRFLSYVHARLFGQMRPVLSQMRGLNRDTLYDYFLFTLVMTVVTPEHTLVASFGDGVAALNGDIKVQRSEDNRPRYPAYGILGDPEPIPTFDFDLLWHQATEQVVSVLIGSDGVEDWLQNEQASLPGKETPLGPLSQFWEDPAYGKNPDAIRRKLSLANRRYQQILWAEQRMDLDEGRLPDDTTLIAIRISHNETER